MKDKSNPLHVFYDSYDEEVEKLTIFERSNLVVFNKTAIERTIKNIAQMKLLVTTRPKRGE